MQAYVNVSIRVLRYFAKRFALRFNYISENQF